MNLTDMPTRVAIPFGNRAGSSYIRDIPVSSQIGVQAGAASFNDGFPPDTFTPLAGGGAYVNGEDANGILNHLSKWTRWQMAGGAAVYDSAFATGAGGYPKGAVLSSTTYNGHLWQSTVDGNVTDPDSVGAVGWVPVGPLAATLAEVEAGVEAAKYVSPLTLAEYIGATQTRQYGQTATGYWEKDLATGLITQWGTIYYNTTYFINLVFPIPFTELPWFSPGLFQTQHGGNQNNVTLESPTLTTRGFTANSTAGGDNNPITMAWMAKGL